LIWITAILQEAAFGRLFHVVRASAGQVMPAGNERFAAGRVNAGCQLPLLRLLHGFAGPSPLRLSDHRETTDVF